MENNLELLLRDIDLVREEFRGILDQVDQSLEICPGWTIKDAIGHITAWEIVIHKAIKAYQADDPPYFLREQDFDVFNEEAVEYRSSWSMERILDEWKEVREDLKKDLSMLSEDDLLVEIVLPWGSERTLAELIEIIAEHEGEHLDNITKVAGL